MEIKLLLTFIGLNILNVVIQTIKSIATVKCGKGAAALINALAYGLYTVVTVYMLCDLPLSVKALVVAGCNLVGVYVVKWVEEKARKDKLWKIEATIPLENVQSIIQILEITHIPYSYVDIKKYYIFNIYCATQAVSSAVKEALTKYDAKYFVSESKTL